jgi:hypothetical protein
MWVGTDVSEERVASIFRVMELRAGNIQLANPQITTALSINAHHEDVKTLDTHIML